MELARHRFRVSRESGLSSQIEKQQGRPTPDGYEEVVSVL